MSESKPAADAAQPNAQKKSIGPLEVLVCMLIVVALFLGWELHATRKQRDQALQTVATLEAQVKKLSPAIDATGDFIETGAKTGKRALTIIDRAFDLFDPPQTKKK